MTDHADFLDRLKAYRRLYVHRFAANDDFDTAAKLAHVQGCIEAVEAVIAEVAPVTVVATERAA